MLQQFRYIVVQFYPWFKFQFLLFQTHYHHIYYHSPKQKEVKFKPRIKLNHNIIIHYVMVREQGRAGEVRACMPKEWPGKKGERESASKEQSEPSQA